MARKRSRSLSRPYTTGELNRTVDALLHPLGKLDPRFIVIDWALHVVIEQNPSESLLKFIQYSLPRLVAQCVRREKRYARA